MTRLLAPISLDLDNEWSYLMVHGDESWTSYPSYMPTLIPRVLDFLDERGMKITFFVVGRDLELPGHADLYSELSRRGHRIGNHSHNHEPWLHRYDADRLEAELRRSEEAIERVMGAAPIGFRGPGFSRTPALLELLAERGYAYDATVFANILNPLSRAYYFRTTDLTPAQREERSQLFGTVRDALQPNRPFRWETKTGRSIDEVPVTTFPGLRTPIHLSYLTYAGSRSRVLASAYFGTALALCRIGSNPPSMLLHPLDFLGKDDVESLGFFPGMELATEKKIEMAHRFLDQLTGRFEPAPIEDFLTSLPEGKSAANQRVVSVSTL
jgi:peptidoglycan/xylan/chitin deacetylase (PgdA/CDA1 family)